MVSVPSQALAALEDSFSRFLLFVNLVIVRMEKSTDPQQFAPALREELNFILEALAFP
jgi:hypothetical protein